MVRKESGHFICKHCNREVPLTAPGTSNRNHCPFCLYSKHVDVYPGDRKSQCGGVMKPIGLITKKDGEIQIVHQCQSCGYVSRNRIAGDDDDDLIEELKGKVVPEALLKK